MLEPFQAIVNRLSDSIVFIAAGMAISREMYGVAIIAVIVGVIFVSGLAFDEYNKR